ncbi:hypothetical protein PCL1606_26020 [Pseudomonas chlororaphis]|uniref:Uncharacterized protein n=1 Tax=Pseudomonas chlororaphis TaxID=587753 RepID=A0A0D5XZA4_9PSED|nr:hypothetical protein PCL1606_26020 [Pseudomonas chlororaphis]
MQGGVHEGGHCCFLGAGLSRCRHATCAGAARETGAAGVRVC